MVGCRIRTNLFKTFQRTYDYEFQELRENMHQEFTHKIFLSGELDFVQLASYLGILFPPGPS